MISQFLGLCRPLQVSVGLIHGRASHIIWPPNRWQQIKPSLPPNRGPVDCEEEEEDGWRHLPHPRLMLRTMIQFSLKTVAFLVFYFLNLNLRKNKFWLWLSESLTVVSTWCLYWLCVFLTYSSNSCSSLCSEELYNKIVLNHWAEPPEVSVMQQQWQRQQ